MGTPWLEKNNLEKWLKTRVKNIESEENNAKGENYLSTLRKLTVTAEDGRIFSLVVKCRKLNGTTGEVYGNTDIFRKEIELYSNTIHGIQDILNKAFPDGIEPLAPECYYACDDYLVLEDLSCSGFKMHNRKIGLDLEHCLLVIRTMARFHAASAILYERNPRAYDKFEVSYYHETSLQLPIGNLLAGFSLTLADELATWEEKWHKYIPKLKKLAEDPMPRVLEVTRRKETDFNVLIHGDFWTNNLLFRDETASLRFVDFQTVTYSSPVIDFIYFLCTSPMVEVRINHVQLLLKEYHTSLTHALKCMCYNKAVPTLEDLNREIDTKAFYGLYTLIAAYALMQCGSHCDFSFDEIMATRKTPGPKMFDDVFKQNVKTLLPFFADKGGFETAD